MSWCRNSSDLGHSNILIDFIVLRKTKKPTNMNVPWVTLTGFSILWNILLIENGKKRKKEKNPSPCEATLFLSSFLSRLLVRKSLQEPLLPVLSLTQQPAAAASLCCVWVLPGDIIICKPMSAGSLERWFPVPESAPAALLWLKIKSGHCSWSWWRCCNGMWVFHSLCVKIPKGLLLCWWVGFSSLYLFGLLAFFLLSLK